LREARDLARKEHEEARRQVEAQLREWTEPVAAEEKQLAALVRQEPHFQKRMPELDREQREVAKLYGELLSTERQTAQVRAELMRLRERTVAIPNEKADLRTQHMRLVSEIKSLETRLAERREKADVLDQELKKLDAAFQAAERDRSAVIKTHEREKARLEKEVDALEIAKANPYQQIGRVLADSNLAPMNQPHALEKVRRQRFLLDQLEYQIALSLRHSSDADAALVRISYMLWGVVAIAACLLWRSCLHDFLAPACRSRCPAMIGPMKGQETSLTPLLGARAALLLGGALLPYSRSSPTLPQEIVFAVRAWKPSNE
jgi:chromosome segregation ATPase